ncbi:MAG: hypothetical protein KME50_08065 [Nostoc desertorum CM1-VF14]|nr:hypothetical protein [Nostoc desertorum CM1-VF14]
MKFILSTTAVFVFVSLSCLPAQRLLAQEIPVAGRAIEPNKNTFSEPPVAGRAIEESKSNQLAFKPDQSLRRRQSTTRAVRGGRVSVRRKSTPRVRPVTYTPQRERVQKRTIIRPTRPSLKVPVIPQNFPIRRG